MVVRGTTYRTGTRDQSLCEGNTSSSQSATFRVAYDCSIRPTLDDGAWSATLGTVLVGCRSMRGRPVFHIARGMACGTVGYRLTECAGTASCAGNGVGATTHAVDSGALCRCVARGARAVGRNDTDGHTNCDTSPLAGTRVTTSTSRISSNTHSGVPLPVRTAAYIALGVALLHIIFGAIVRISGSGMGCGIDWPTCQGYWIPPYFTRVDLAVELTHRYLAIALFASIAWLALSAWRQRDALGVRGEGGVLNAAYLALGLWFAPALFGAVTVFTGNPAWATVVHKFLAASLIAVIVIAAVRAGGLGSATLRADSGTSKAVGGATAAAILALLVVLLGGLTAKIPGAAVACVGFPLCGVGSTGGGAQHVQLTHRILAYLLVLHVMSLPFVYRRRGEPAPVLRVAWLAMLLGVMQIAWAGWMVTGGFPSVVRSLHQATGILIWVACVTMAYLTRIASGRSVIASQRPQQALRNVSSPTLHRS